MDQPPFHFVDFDLKDLVGSEETPFDELPPEVQKKRSRLDEIVGSKERSPNYLKDLVDEGETPLEEILGNLSISDDAKESIRASAIEFQPDNYENPDAPNSIVVCYFSWQLGFRVCRRIPHIVHPDS